MRRRCIDAVPQAPAAPGPNDAKYLVVDYDDVDGLAKILDAQSIDTVISALSMESMEAQNKLVTAAGKSSTAKRFIPSEYAGFEPE